MLEHYGWSDALQNTFSPLALLGLEPARVVVQQRGLLTIVTFAGERRAHVSGRLAAEAAPGGLPVAGDFVAVSPSGPDETAIIRQVLPRHGVFSRRAAGPGGGLQVVGANIDLALITASLNDDFNPRRLERYLAAAWAGGAEPAFLLTKADLDTTAGVRLAEVERLSPSTRRLAVSAVTGEGLDTLGAWLQPGRTAALLGSSGVGKSTLVNALSGGGRMAVGGIREDDARGRHTTTHRELIRLPGGALLLDTPGMRELGLTGAEEGVSAAFADVEALAGGCRFRDCAHEGEPGCAVRAALESGDLEEGRWRSYAKLGRELAFEARKEDPVLRAEHGRLWAKRAKANRAREKARNAQRNWT